MDYLDAKIAALYDLANPVGEDARFYLSLAGQQPCSVLDLGCGTGTLCCALAKRGHRVTGVDPAAAMLAVARTKPDSKHVEWVESSAQSYRSSQRFDLVTMSGHVFQVLLSDADALAVLDTMRRHLNHRGRVIFDTRNPCINWAAEWEARSRTLPGAQIVETLRITSADAEFISFETSYRLPDTTLITSSTLRFPSRQHFENLIERSGLVVHHVFGNWDSSPFDSASSREIIFVAGTKQQDS
jgi:2-polyprenyl-3-methyl-5-hydroxy-6-metoxy-1,4-benzoquinol methylase